MTDEDGEYCVNCNVAIAGGMLLDVCGQHAEFTKDDKKSGVSCNSLRKDFEAGKITAGQLLKEIEARVHDPKHKKELSNIKAVAKEHGINLETE